MDIPRGLFFFFFHLVSRENKRSTCPEIRCTGYSFHSGGWEALQKRDWLHVGTRFPPKRKRTSPETTSCWWPLWRRTGSALPAPCGPREAAGAPPGQVHRARLRQRRAPPAAGHGWPRSRDLPRLRAAVSGAARRPGSDYRFTRGARPAAAQPPPARPRAAPLPRLPILLHSCGRPAPPPPPPARPPSPPPAARIGWRPWRRHFPTARGACGSPAALQARPWRAARPIGARGAGRDRGRRRACVPARPPPPARRRPTAAAPPLPHHPPAPPTSGDPAEPPRSRRTAAGQGPAWRAGAGAGFALAPSLALVPPRSGCQSTEREAGLAEGRLLPRSRRPASPPPRPPPPPLLPSPGT